MKKTALQELSFKQLAWDMVWCNSASTALILGSMIYNAEIWVNDYPPDIKEKFGPMSAKTKRDAALVAIPFFTIMIGGLLWSNGRLKRRNGGYLSPQAAFLNAFALILSGWAFDLTVLDWWMFVKKTPDFVVLAGTEGMAGYDDYLFHLKEHTRALPLLVGFALIIAWVTSSSRIGRQVAA